MEYRSFFLRCPYYTTFFPAVKPFFAGISDSFIDSSAPPGGIIGRKKQTLENQRSASAAMSNIFFQFLRFDDDLLGADFSFPPQCLTGIYFVTSGAVNNPIKDSAALGMPVPQHGNGIVQLLNCFGNAGSFQLNVIGRLGALVQQQKVTPFRAGTGWKHFSVNLILFNIV